MTPRHAGLHAWAVEGIGEVAEGDDLADLLDGTDLQDGDVVLVTSKVVAKAEGRVRPGDRDEDKQAVIDEESVRVVARRGPTRVVEHRLGLVMAAAGVDASNVTAGHLVLLPLDPDASARALREELARRGVDVAVVVTDTAGRAWRVGQTELAVGLAGLDPLETVAEVDGYGNPLVVTAPAVADELADVAELVTGKTAGRPVSVVRGLGERLLPPGDHGPGARALVRPRSLDMFALGAREAVLAALAGTQADCFGAPADRDEVRATLLGLGLPTRDDGDGLAVDAPDEAARVRSRAAAHALAWRADDDGGPEVRLLPRPT